MKNIFNISLLLAIVLLFGSCRKDQDIIPVKVNGDINLKLNINYKVDGIPLLFDSIMYFNDAGNNYEVTRLEYFISNITFHSTTGKDFAFNKIMYVNAQTPLTNSILIENVPAGEYNSISLNIGLDSAHNISNSLPNTNENINMAWPSSMGGGYHFMKMEGYYVYPPTTTGFTMHLGKNSSLVYCIINKAFTVEPTSTEIKLSMNLNEWFRHPIMYDFNVDGNFTMGNNQAMGKIAANGIDVFSYEL